VTRLLATLITVRWRLDAATTREYSNEDRGTKRELLIGIAVWMIAGAVIVAINA